MTPLLPVLILTYFEPFAGRIDNRSEVVARALAQEASKTGAFHRVELCEVPVIYESAVTVALDCIRRATTVTESTWVVSLGEWLGSDLRIETAAHNRDHTPDLADNSGEIRKDREILPGGAPSLGFRFPMSAFFLSPELRDLHPRVSSSPGAFLCNHLAYRLTEHLGRSEIPFLFVHVGRNSLRSSKIEAVALADALAKSSVFLRDHPLPSRNPTQLSEVEQEILRSEDLPETLWWLERLRSDWGEFSLQSPEQSLY